MKSLPVSRWTFAWTDRRHFEIAAGPFRITRWCTGTPCRHSARPVPHPVTAVRLVARWSQQ